MIEDEKQETLKTLSDFYGKTMVIIQTSFTKSSYELKDGDELVSTLEIKKILGRQAEISYYDNVWEVKKEGFWKNNYIIFEKDSQKETAKVINRLFKNPVIELPRGGKLILKTRIFKGITEIQTELENPIANIKGKISWKEKADVTFEQKHKLLNENPWLIMLVWFFEVLRSRQSHAAFH